MKQDDGLAQEENATVVAAMEKARKSTHVVKDVPAQAAVAAGDDERELPLGGELHPQPLLEMGDQQDKEIQGVQALLNNHEGDTEAGRDPSNLPAENGSASSIARKESKRMMHHYLKLALLLVTISTVPLIDILFLRGSAPKLPLGLKFAAFFAFTAFVTAISLMFHTLKLMKIKPEHIIIAINQLKVSIVLLAISISSLILTSISITCSLLPKAYYFLPISLFPSILVGVFHFISCIKCNKNVRPEESKTLKKALKSATQLTLSLVTTSFSGFIGDLLGIYHKTEKLGGQFSYAKVSIFFMLGAGLAGILALLLCRLLSNSEDHRRNQLSPSGIWWQRTVLAIANVVMLTMLVPALLLIAATILHGLLVPAVVFPAVAGAAAWVFIEFCTAAADEEDDGGRTEEEDGKAELGTMYAIAVAVASVSFGAVLAVFGGLLGGGVGKGQLKVCTFFLTSAFVAAVSLGVVASVAPARKVSVAVAAAVLAYCGLGTLVLAALALFYQIGSFE